MMDRIVVTAADIDKLLEWRDGHTDLVRSMPIPLREVKIQVVDNGISIKCFRSDKKLKLYLENKFGRFGHVIFVPATHGNWMARKNDIPAEADPHEMARAALTVYSSLMALMAYGASEAPAATEVEHEPKAHTAHKRSTRWNPVGTTYILHSSGKRLSVAPKGHHASPNCSFTVRGHFRHYRSGKTVWIAEYRKGTGRDQSKTYKIGGDFGG